MNWPPPAGAHLLAPFDHQVAGQSSMLRYDESTVCKPLITREHFVYQTLPEGLKEFTPEYRGELEVGLAEKDGYLQLYGLCVKDSNEDLCQCSLQETAWEHLSGPDAPSEKDYDGQLSIQSVPNVVPDMADQNRCVIRVLRSGSYEICSMTSDKTIAQPTCEINAQVVKPPSLNPWSLKNHKSLLDKMRKGKHRHNSFRCILLKNVVADFRYPCILDLKIGSRLHGDDASADKIKTQSRKCAETTSNTLGVRLCGMQVYHKDSGQNINLDKFQGRLLTDETFKKTLYSFLHNGVRYRPELLQPIINKLSSLIECLHTVGTYRFYASSLLIIYDGLEEDMGKVLNQTVSNNHYKQCSKQANRYDLKSSSTTTEIRSDEMTNSKSFDQRRNINGHVEMSLDMQKNYNKTIQMPPLSKSENDNAHNPNEQINHGPNRSLFSDTSISQHNFDNGVKSLSQKCSDSFHTLCQSHTTCSDLNAGNHNQTLKYSECQLQSVTECKVFNHSPELKNHQTASNGYPSHILPERNTVSAQVFKVDVKMIDFAHTTHQGFPNDECRHEGPDMDYIQGLTNLKILFQNLMAEC